MDPVTLSKPQSRTFQQLSRHLYDARNRGDAVKASLYMDATQAGWDIDVPIISGDFLAHAAVSHDLTSITTTLLTDPSSRKLLLDERVSHIALARMFIAQGTSVAISSFHRLLDLSGEEMVARALRTINAARAEAGRGPVTEAPRYQRAAELLSDAIARGTTTPRDATNRLLDAMVDGLNTSVRYRMISSHDLDAISVPEHIVNARHLRAAVIAAPYRHPADPWTRYRIVIMYAESDLR